MFDFLRKKNTKATSDVSPKRLLIVDDVEFTVDFENTVIESLSQDINITIETDIAYTVQEALDKISANAPYDAIVTDMNLPDGTGSDIAQAARSKSPSTRLAALTIYPSKYQHEETLFDVFLRKPIMPKLYRENLIFLLELT